MGEADSPPATPRFIHPAEDEFAAVSRAVIALLQTRNTARFAGEITASAEDWKAIASTNLPGMADNLKSFAEGVDDTRSNAETAAKAFLAKADSLHLDFSKGDFHPRVVNPRFLGTSHYPTLQAEGETLPWVQKVEIILDVGAETEHLPAGEYKIVLRRLNKFPGGWRCMGGIQWESFPANVADEKTAREMAILEKAASFKGITGNDDPALMRLAQTLVEFLRQRDLGIYTKEALENSDLAWAQIQKSGEKGPSRQELEEEINSRNKEHMETARLLLNQNDAAGIDFQHAQIQIEEAAIERLQGTTVHSSLEGLMGDQFKLRLAIKSESKSKTGAPLSGEYVLAIDRVERYADSWRVSAFGHGLRWDQLPAGVVDEKAVAAMEFENYVAEHGCLPPRTSAPEIEFTTLDGGKKTKLWICAERSSCWIFGLPGAALARSPWQICKNSNEFIPAGATKWRLFR